MANVRTCGGITSDFSITIRLHQGSALSPFLFAIVMVYSGWDTMVYTICWWYYPSRWNESWG